MAKTQNLSLNPTKISGTCGRLMCCLNYEQEAYEDLLRTCPKAESFVDTPDGRGTVVESNLLRQSVRVRLEKQPDTLVTHKNCDICILRSGKPKKTDEPIPEDLAPISGKRPKNPTEASSFATYLEPVRLKSSVEPIAEATSKQEPKHEEQKGGRRNRRNHRKDGKPEAAPAKKPEEKPLKAEKLLKQEPKQDKKLKPAKEEPETAVPTKKNNHRRYYHRRKSGKGEG